jgi:hypothetical protein
MFHPKRVEGDVMKKIAWLTIASVAMIGSAGASDHFASPGIRLAQAKTGEVCVQVISCGTKNGTRKEYPTPCAAKDDGATDISPKTGPTC